MSKYVVKGFDIDGNVVISVVCPVDDISLIVEMMNDEKLKLYNVRITYLDPEYNKE